MKNKLSFLILLAALTVSSLACKLLNGNQPTPADASPVSNVYMASDPEGLNKTNVFAPKDAIYIFFDANQPKIGTAFEARWYVLNLPEEVDPNVPFTTNSYIYDGGSTTIQAYIQSSHEDGFAPSLCKVEIYMDGVKVAEQLFSIE
ncbi:MAG: hypothetical protein HYU84_16250 [Chloroflexi bacterium]|nr:hypothetical protein [Chloroflexota bacterium]MBI3167890.1 hypothetical protein [Chloroflexota bacterium]